MLSAERRNPKVAGALRKSQAHLELPADPFWRDLG